MKKGFTLIELLAVIVILAIILLIAMPIVLNVIKEARKGAFNSTGFGLTKTAENAYMRRTLDGSTTTIWYSFTDSVQTAYLYVGDAYVAQPDMKLEYSGKGPVDGVIKVYSTGEVAMWLHNGTYCAYLTKAGTEVATDESNVATCLAKDLPTIEDRALFLNP